MIYLLIYYDILWNTEAPKRKQNRALKLGCLRTATSPASKQTCPSYLVAALQRKLIYLHWKNQAFKQVCSICTATAGGHWNLGGQALKSGHSNH